MPKSGFITVRDGLEGLWERASLENAAQQLHNYGEGLRRPIDAVSQHTRAVLAQAQPAARQVVARVSAAELAARRRVEQLAQPAVQAVRGAVDRVLPPPPRQRPSPASAAGLRGPVSAATSITPRRLEYVADLTDPRIAPFVTKRANADGSRAYILANPASNLGVRTSYEGLKADLEDLRAGRPGRQGPRITFINDEPQNPTPNQPLKTATAGMVSAAILNSGVNSVNINSTTGGDHKGLYHPASQAVDMNRVNGEPVGFNTGRKDRAGRYIYMANSDPEVVAGVASLQNALRRQPNIHQNFGPAFQEVTPGPGQRPRPAPSTRDGHQNHVHAGGLPVIARTR